MREVSAGEASAPEASAVAPPTLVDFAREASTPEVSVVAAFTQLAFTREEPAPARHPAAVNSTAFLVCHRMEAYTTSVAPADLTSTARPFRGLAAGSRGAHRSLARKAIPPTVGRQSDLAVAWLLDGE